MKKGPTTPKGFRDIDPELAKKRREVIGKIADVLESFDFVPIETPTLEFAETLLGKYGEDERLIYQFTDRGKRKLALRFDLTVPLARYVANNLGVLKPTFSRYQIGQAFRGEKPQKGRYREFTQFDFDIVGSTEIAEDARVIAAAIKSTRKAGLGNVKMLINDRERFSGIPVNVIRLFDKFDKIGLDGVVEQLSKAGVGKEKIEKYKSLITEGIETVLLNKLFNLLQKEYGLKRGKDFGFNPALARGLDYYTSTIFELKPNGRPDELSIGGGGRYDNLIGTFAGREIPAVGFSFGLDRLIELV